MNVLVGARLESRGSGAGSYCLGRKNIWQCFVLLNCIVFHANMEDRWIWYSTLLIPTCSRHVMLIW